MFESLSSNPFYRIFREQGFNPASRWDAPKVPQIECDQDICPAIYRRFQNHLIIWVAELGSPQKMCLHWLSHRNNRIHKNADLPCREPSRQPMPGSVTDSFV